MKPYIDEGAISDKEVRYTKKNAIKTIKSLLENDEDLLRGRDIETMSDDDILEIGHHFYSIYKD